MATSELPHRDRTLNDLPDRKIVVVAVDRTEPQYAERGADYFGRMIGMLRRADPGQVKHVQDVRDFQLSAPKLVNVARRRYPGIRPTVPSVGHPSIPEPIGSRLPMQLAFAEEDR